MAAPDRFAPLESLAEILSPDHTAVLVVDMQNDYCPRPEPATPHEALPSILQSIEPQARLITEAVRSGVMVVYIKNTSELGHVSESPTYIRRKAVSRKKSLQEGPGDFVMEGSWGQDVIGELEGLAPNAPVVRKHRASAFVNTSADLLLRSNKIKSVVVTGCVTEGCLSATVRDALAHDYYCVVPRDCVGGFHQDRHEAALEVLDSLVDVVDSARVMAVWNELRGRSQVFALR